MRLEISLFLVYNNDRIMQFRERQGRLQRQAYNFADNEKGHDRITISKSNHPDFYSRGGFSYAKFQAARFR